MTLKSGTLIQTGITNCKSVSEKRPTLKRFFIDWLCHGWSSLQLCTTTKSLRSRVNYVTVYITESSHELAFRVCCRHQVRTHQSRQQIFCFVLLVYLSSFFFFSLCLFVSLPSVCTADIKYRESELLFSYLCINWGGQWGWRSETRPAGQGTAIHSFLNATAELMIFCTVWPPITWQHKNDSTGMKYWSNTSTVCTSTYL